MTEGETKTNRALQERACGAALPTGPVGYASLAAIRNMQTSIQDSAAIVPESDIMADGDDVPVYLHPHSATLDDAARLDYLQRTGSTLEILPGTRHGARFRFRVGGLHAAVSDDLRAAIDAASNLGRAKHTETK